MAARQFLGKRQVRDADGGVATPSEVCILLVFCWCVMKVILDWENLVLVGRDCLLIFCLMYVCMHVCMYVYICIYIYIYVCVLCVCVCVCGVCILCIYIYIFCIDFVYYCYIPIY